MTVKAKICGINTMQALDAAIDGGAGAVGFVFYPPSPRAISPDTARTLAEAVPDGVLRVALTVDMDDAGLGEIAKTVPLDIVQLHGGEPPRRVAEIKAMTGLQTMKAIRIAAEEDIADAHAYLDVVDRILFDAKPPADMKGALPGGNALSFDWQWLSGRTWPVPWMLSGGLTPENVAQAVEISGADFVDVSSGVEIKPGEKDPERIAAFLNNVAAL